MSRKHLITSKESDRIYKGVSRIARDGFAYETQSMNDDLEEYNEAISNNAIQNETKELFFLPKCERKDWINIEDDEKRKKLYFDYNKFGRNPDVPIELMEFSESQTRYCYASALRETEVFNSPE